VWFAAQFDNAKSVLGPTQTKRIEMALERDPMRNGHQARSFEYAIEKDLSNMVGESETEYSGWRKPQLRKLFAMISTILDIVPPPVYKMRLLKLMFYADFAYFRQSTHSISGWPYARLQYGPVPDRYEEILCQAIRQGMLISEPDTEERGDILQTGKAADDLHGVLSTEEKMIVGSVCRTLGHLTATQLSALTHKEDAWLFTENAKRISYDHALTLKAIASG
jgi:uncharacterized phage-associated protein